MKNPLPPIVNHCNDTEYTPSLTNLPQDEPVRPRPCPPALSLRLVELNEEEKKAGLAHYQTDNTWINKFESTKHSKLSYSNNLLVELTAGDDPPLVINFTEDFSDREKIFEKLMKLNEKEVIFVECRQRGCVSTGVNSKRTLELLSKISEFRIFLTIYDKKSGLCIFSWSYTRRGDIIILIRMGDIWGNIG